MAADQPQAARKRSRVWIQGLAIGALWLVFAWPALRVLGGIYSTNDNYAHGFLIPLLAMYLAYERRHRLASTAAASSRRFGVLLTALGVGLTVFGRWYELGLDPGYLGYVFLCGAGLIICLAGVMWSVLGAARVRILRFPLAYLLLAIPLPESVTLYATLPLRACSVIGADFVLRHAGFVVLRDGNVLHLAGGQIGVDEACSGIRSIWALLALALLFAPRLCPRRVLLLLLAVPVVAVAANFVRVVLTGLAVAWGHPDLASGASHTLLGLLTLMPSAAAIAWLGVALGTRPRAAARLATGEGGATSRQARPDPRSGATQGWLSVAGVGLLLAIGIAGASAIEQHYRAHPGAVRVIIPQRRLLADFPARIGPFERTAMYGLSLAEDAALQPSDRLVAAYADPTGACLTLTILYWYPEQITLATRYAFNCPHSPDWCYVANGWQRVSHFGEDAVFPWLPGESVSIRLYSKAELAQVLVFWRETGCTESPEFVPRPLVARLKALVNSWHAPPTARVRARYGVTIAVDVATSPAAARQTGLRFAEAVAALLPDYGIAKEPVGDGHSNATSSEGTL